MLTLTASTQDLKIALGGSPSSELPLNASFVEFNPVSGTFTPSMNNTVTNGTSDVTLMGGPSGANVYRQLKSLSVPNTATGAVTATIKIISSGPTTHIILKVTLQPGEQLQYSDKGGWQVLTLEKTPKVGETSEILSLSRFMKDQHYAADATTGLTGGNTDCDCVHMGTCPVKSTSVSVRYRVAQEATTITFAEVGIYRGRLARQGNLNQQVVILEKLGQADVSGVVNSAGIKTTTVTLSEPILPGDELWVGFRNWASQRPTFRAKLADDIRGGKFALGTVPQVTGFSLAALVNPYMAAVTQISRAVIWCAAYVN